MILTTLCIFQVQGRPAAAPRASGCMSVIPQFRRYQSRGFSTLRPTCSSMRKCSNVTSRSLFPLLYFVWFLYSLYSSPPFTESVSGWKEGKKENVTVLARLTSEELSFKYSVSIKTVTLTCLGYFKDKHLMLVIFTLT